MIEAQSNSRGNPDHLLCCNRRAPERPLAEPAFNAHGGQREIWRKCGSSLGTRQTIRLSCASRPILELRHGSRASTVAGECRDANHTVHVVPAVAGRRDIVWDCRRTPSFLLAPPLLVRPLRLPAGLRLSVASHDVESGAPRSAPDHAAGLAVVGRASGSSACAAGMGTAPRIAAIQRFATRATLDVESDALAFVCKLVRGCLTTATASAKWRLCCVEHRDEDSFVLSGRSLFGMIT